MSDEPLLPDQRLRLKVRSKCFNSSIRHGKGSSVWSRRPLPESTRIIDSDTPKDEFGMPLLFTDEEMYEQAREALMTRMINSRNEMAQVAAATYVYNQMKGMPVARQLTATVDPSSLEETAAIRNRVLDRVNRLAEQNEPQLTIEGAAETVSEEEPSEGA